MARPADRAHAPTSTQEDLVPASGVYRVVMILLAAWTFFAGLALVTQGVDVLSFGADNTAERIIGAQLLMLVPVYVLIVWRPEEYRYLRWMPYAAQLAIAIPVAWDILLDEHDFPDGLLFVVVSVVFFGMLLYVRTSSHPLDFFWPDGDDEEAEEEEYADDEEDLVDEEEPAPRRAESQSRGRRYRRTK